MEKIRLQKYISACGLMSRRAAEEEIRAGAFRVNGEIAEIGASVDPDTDVILYHDQPLDRTPAAPEDHIYLLLNKPAGYVTTLSDEEGRKTVADLLTGVGRRVYPVGRLDLYSDGLLLCTDDGELTNRITHPSHAIPKTYLATITSHLSQEDLAALAIPFTLDGYPLRPFDVAFVAYATAGKAPATVVSFTLYEGRNREIRKICAHHGYKLARLTRVSIGSLTLDGIPSGKWRLLTPDEVQMLRNY